MNVVLAAEAQHSVGWGNPIALVLTALAFWGFTVAHKRYKDIKSGKVTPSRLPSPKPLSATVSTVKPQVAGTVTPEIEAPAAPAVVVVNEQPLTGSKRAAVEAFINSELDQNIQVTEIVRKAVADFGVSETTAWRAVRTVKGKKTA